MTKPTNKHPTLHAPRWIMLVLIVTGLLLILRLSGIIHIPQQWFIGAVVLELALAAFEITVLIITIRFFYRKQRLRGLGRAESMTRAQIDELRTGGLPEKFARPLEKTMLFEMNLYKNIYKFIRRRN